MHQSDLPRGWDVWHHDEGSRLILAFEPTVFDGDRFPPACLPTLYVREGERDPRVAGPGLAHGTEGSWSVTLFLEPDVSRRFGSFPDWERAVEAALATAGSFSRGELDLRGFYEAPREAYLAELEALVGEG